MVENENTKKKNKRRKAARRREKTSIYFALWAGFTAFSLFIVLLFGISQSASLRKTYEHSTLSELFETGSAVKKEYEKRVDQLGTTIDPDDFFRVMGSGHNVCVALLDENGDLLYPSEEDDLSCKNAHMEAKNLVQKLKNDNESIENGFEIIELEGECLYLSETDGRYLLVGKQMDVDPELLRQMNGRTVLIAVFVTLLSFVLSATMSAVLVKPISEMTQKAKRLADGDFSVDFRGRSYAAETDALAETLNYARDEISKADAMQKELIANVSHDFKTPLTMIKAYASMIQEISGGDPVKREKHAQVIIEETDRLTELVTDVLDLSKLTSGLNEIKTELFDLSTFTAQVLEKFGYLAETQGYTFETHIEEGLYTQADRVKIGQVIYNLVGNAINYTGEDKRVTVLLRRAGDRIRFSVKDTGVGMSEEDVRSIWNRYYRSKEMHKRSVKGSGLGLPIVKTVLDKHGFEYGVKSRENEGSEFYVYFPLI